MKFHLKTHSWEKSQTDLVLSFIYEDEKNHVFSSDLKIQNYLQKAVRREEFTGREGESITLSIEQHSQSYKFSIIGLGKKESFNLYRLQKAVSLGVINLRKIKGTSLTVNLDNELIRKMEHSKMIESVVESVILSSYRFKKYKGAAEKLKIKDISDVYILVIPQKLSAAQEAITTGLFKAEATCFARDLVNEPADVTTPQYLADTSRSIAKESDGAVKVDILEKEEVEKLGMNSYLGVARGSDKPPKFIRLIYKNPYSHKKVVLVGKGITFDTGGLSLKSPEHMETMKLDMAGAAVVLSIFKYIHHLKPKLLLVGIIPACENMPSGKALHPGDVLTAMNGKSIEVLNTDAEGRLTLADAFSYASMKEKPDCLIDVATLTGACMVALGQNIAGVWGNNKELVNKIIIASDKTGEKIWEMPLEEEYKPLIKSEIADIKNIQTGRYGGAITAALFLSEFVQDVAWAHLDIAGPAFEEQGTGLIPKGGTGFGVRLLLEFLQSL